MDADKIAVAGLVVGAVGGVAGIVGAVAAVLAAKYAKGSATQAGLESVERNTARTTEEVVAVRSHIAQVDEHLRLQNDWQSTEAAARATSISVAGEVWHDRSSPFSFRVHTPGVVIKSVDLVNEADLFSGTAACAEVSPGEFAATITPDAFAKWMQSGQFIPQDKRVVFVKAALEFGGRFAVRKFPVEIVSSLRQRSDCTTYYYTTSGKC